SERILSGTAKSLWYHYGPQGEARQLSNSSGTVADSYLYTGYGVLLSSSGSDTNLHRFGGKYGYYWDANLKSHLAGQRWYTPGLMRWLTRDPILYDGGDNPYAYVGDAPIGWIDPDGLDSWEQTFENAGMVAGGAVGGTVGVAAAGGATVASGGPGVV